MKNTKKAKRVCEFEIADMLPIGLTLVVTGIGIAYGLSVVGDMKTDMIKDKTLSWGCNSTINGGTGNNITGCGADVTAAGDVVTGVAKLPSKMPLIVTVVVAALVIGILVRYLMVKYN